MNTTNSYFVQAAPVLTAIYQQMNLWLTVIVLIPGWILNMIVALVFMNKKFWKNSSPMGYYYCLQPILSNLFLTTNIVFYLTTHFGLDLALSNFTACVFFYSAKLVFNFGAQFFSVQMTVDRALNIVSPRHFRFMSKPLNLLKVTVAIYVAISIYGVTFQSFRQFTYKNMTQPDNTTISVPSACSFSYIVLAANNMTFCAMRTLGLLITLIANSFIINKIIDSRNSVSKQGGPKMSSRDKSYALTISFANLCQFIFYFPFMVVLFIQLSYALNPDLPLEIVTYYNLVYVILAWCNSLYEAMHFWINLVTNKTFRHELKRIIAYCRAALVDLVACPSEVGPLDQDN